MITATTTATRATQVGGADTRYNLQTGDQATTKAGEEKMYNYMYETEDRKMLWHIFPLRVL